MMINFLLCMFFPNKNLITQWRRKRKSTQIKQYPIFHCHHTFSSNNREKNQKYCQCWQHKLIKHITKWFDCFYFFVFFFLYTESLAKISNSFLGFVTKSWDLQKWEIRYFSFLEIFWFFLTFCSVYFTKSKWGVECILYKSSVSSWK